MSIVAKFGGSSVANAEQIQKVLLIVKQHIDTGVVLVASAMGKSTDELVNIMHTCSEGHRARGLDMLNHMRERHLCEIHAITDHHILSHAIKRIELLCDEMQAICIDIAAQKGINDSQQAYLLAHGELLSTTIIYAMARWHEIACELLDSREFIKSDNSPLKAEVDWKKSTELIQENIDVSAQKLYIAQGFIASSAEGRTTTLGRGGSDYSAAIIGAALNVDTIEIWTDVDGVLTTDPGIVPHAKSIDALTYGEAAELSYFGAKVIHPLTMMPAIKSDIPLNVRNTNNPSHKGTIIGGHTKKQGVRAIAVKDNIIVINVQSYRMLHAYGFLSKIFAVFANHNKAVDLIATSEVSISLTVDNNEGLPTIIDELALFAKVERRELQSIVSIVGQNVWKNARVVAKVFETMDTIPIHLLTLGGSDTNLSLVIDSKLLVQAVTALHHTFFDN